MTDEIPLDPDAFYATAIAEPACMIGETDTGDRLHVLILGFAGGPNHVLTPDAPDRTLNVVLSEEGALRLASWIVEHAADHGAEERRLSVVPDPEETP